MRNLPDRIHHHGQVEWTKDVGAEELRQRLSRNPMDDLAEQQIIGSGVGELGAGLELQVRYCRERLQGLILGGAVAELKPLRPEQPFVLGDAAGLVDQLGDGDSGGPLRKFRQVLGQRVVESQLSLVGEQQDRGGSELLGYRADVEHGVRGNFCSGRRVGNA